MSVVPAPPQIDRDRDRDGDGIVTETETRDRDRDKLRYTPEGTKRSIFGTTNGLNDCGGEAQVL